MKTESFVSPFAKEVIEWWLDIYRNTISVVASRMTEEGWELVVEGSKKEVSMLVWILGEVR